MAHRKHPIDELKNLAYERFLTRKNPYKDLHLCSFSYVKYSEKCLNQIYRALCGDAKFVRDKYSGRKAFNTADV